MDVLEPSRLRKSHLLLAELAVYIGGLADFGD